MKMPIRKLTRRSTTNDLDSVRAAIAAGVHLLPPEQQQDATRNLTGRQQSLLSHLCPTYKSVHYFLSGSRPTEEQIKAARIELQADIERAKR
jgi:hypothetical protein